MGLPVYSRQGIPSHVAKSASSAGKIFHQTRNKPTISQPNRWARNLPRRPSISYFGASLRAIGPETTWCHGNIKDSTMYIFEKKCLIQWIFLINIKLNYELYLMLKSPIIKSLRTWHSFAMQDLRSWERWDRIYQQHEEVPFDRLHIS